MSWRSSFLLLKIWEGLEMRQESSSTNQTELLLLNSCIRYSTIYIYSNHARTIHLTFPVCLRAVVSMQLISMISPIVVVGVL
ncbi:hypothetical protein F4774DRAFT_379494 [Daldinia eschscholtzii]|nr:hypothetical protein F4774DRAFT_379494 [Daldinia eschscholtzii]